MLKFEIVKGGVKKFHAWGSVIVYSANPEDCFSLEDLTELISQRAQLPQDALSAKELAFLNKLKAKRKNLAEAEMP